MGGRERNRTVKEGDPFKTTHPFHPSVPIQAHGGEGGGGGGERKYELAPNLPTFGPTVGCHHSNEVPVLLDTKTGHIEERPLDGERLV